MSWVSLQVRLPAGGGAEDARGLFWILDEEVWVEGSQDSVVLQRVCAAAEKRGAGAGGEGGSPGVGAAEASVGAGVCLPRSPGKACAGEGSAPAWGCLDSFLCSFTHVSITCSERALIYTEASRLMGPPSVLGVRQGWETTS